MSVLDGEAYASEEQQAKGEAKADGDLTGVAETAEPPSGGVEPIGAAGNDYPAVPSVSEVIADRSVEDD